VVEHSKFSIAFLYFIDWSSALQTKHLVVVKLCWLTCGEGEAGRKQRVIARQQTSYQHYLLFSRLLYIRDYFNIANAKSLFSHSVNFLQEILLIFFVIYYLKDHKYIDGDSCKKIWFQEILSLRLNYLIFLKIINS
jgi:hypothetical protein